MEKTSIYAYIKFMGNNDFPLEALTESLGVKPTSTWKVGDRVNKHTPLERFYTCWKYESEKLETLDPEDVLRPLLDLFKLKVDIINQLKEQLDLEVQIELVIEIKNGQTPSLVIYPELSDFAAAINALIDIDMYVYTFSESEE